MEEIKNKEILKFSIEVILQVLKIIEKKRTELEKIGDISGAEILAQEVLPKYEKLYGGLTGEGAKEFKEEDLKNIKEHIDNIMVKNGLSEEFIMKQSQLREKLKGESGAEVIKRFFDYEKKELEKTKWALLDKAEKVLDEEEHLSMEMKNAIQEEEQIEYIYKLQPIREKYRQLEEKILKAQSKIDTLKKKLESEWYYEIYGTISKDEMLKIYKETMK